MRISILCSAIVLLLLGTASIYGQESAQSADLAGGFQPYQSYHGGDIDNVDLMNGNLTVKIPLISYPQRGGKLKLSFSLVWNGKPWTIIKVCVPKLPCTIHWGINGNLSLGYQDAGGIPQSGSGSAVVDDQDVETETYTFIYQTDPVSKQYYDRYITMWRSSDGAVHAGIQTSTPQTGQISDDGAGYFNGYNQLETCSAYCYTLDSGGTVYHPSTGVLRQDANGNQITTDSQHDYVDTVGRVIPPPPTAASASTSGNSSGCTGPLPTYSTALWQIPGVNGGTLTYKFCYAQVAISLPAADGAVAYTSTSIDLQSIVLPNLQTWTFEYSGTEAGDPSGLNYGDLTKITFPTGGTLSYTYVNSPPADGSYALNVASRTVNANDGSGAHTWTYTGYAQDGGASTQNLTVGNPDGTQVVHQFTALQGAAWYETATKYYQGAAGSGTLLRTMQTAYQAIIWANTAPVYPEAINVFPITKTTILDNGQQSVEQLQYCCAATVTGAGEGTGIPPGSTLTYGLLSDDKQYDYSGSLLRDEQTTYEWQSNSAYTNANLLQLIASHTILNGSGTQVEATNHTYDESQYLVASGVTEQHVTPTASVRGNPTTTVEWLNTGSSPTSHTAWYDTGETQQQIDPLSHAITYAYSPTYFGSLPTQVTNALNQSTTYAYDFNTGQKTSVTDPNSQTTTYSYNDSLGRLTDILYPNLYPGSGTHGETKYTYNDSATPVNFVVTKVVSPTLSLSEEVDVDGLGREWYTKFTSDPQGTTYTAKSYDALGRLYQEWNPTRCSLPGSSSCSGEPTFGITTHLYDAINRPTVLIPPDGTSGADNVTTTYSGNTSTTVDQAGVSRTSTTDALDRLTQVTENNMGWTTAYTYDALNNLTCVEQHGNVSSTGCSSSPSNDPSSLWRVRRFSYDSLSRLLTAKNPETGTITYGYNADSVLTSKTDNRGIMITYTPDVLHRITQKTYSDSEPTITFSYDATGTNNYGVGRRTGMTDASGSTTWTYDQLGNEWSEARTIGTVQKTISKLYNADESDAQITYPSGAVVTFTPGGAGRPLAVTDTTHQINYSQSVLYAPSGLVNSAVYGYRSGFAGITETDGYTSRLQPSVLSAASASQTVLSLSYNFGLGVNDNGNVYQVQNNKNNARSQTFTYDGVNRVLTAKTASTWGVSFVYDPWGNLYQTNAITGTSMNPMSVNQQASGANQFMLLGYGYDTAGNVLNDGSTAACPGPAAYSFNAEEQETCAAGITYSYNGDGTRVKKSSGTLYWGSGSLAESDLSGNLTSEYIFLNGKRIARRDVSTGNVYYYFSDHLGSSNVVTDSSGNIQNESDYYPFGGEGVITQNLTNQKYKFTGKERDTESGNDYFGARYYASKMGRMMSPDPGNIGANPANPQSWNMYSYSLNNPLTFTDPTGLYTCADSAKCDSANDKAFASALSAARDAANKLTGDDKAAALKAIGSYGDATKDNGVKVGFDSSVNGGLTQVSGVANGNKSDLNPNGQNISVTFNSNFANDAYGGADLVSHEGSHVSDGSAWVASGFSSNFDPTYHQGEIDANHVQFNIMNSINNTNFPSGWTGASLYGGSPKWDQGNTFKMITPDLGNAIRKSYAAQGIDDSKPSLQKGAVLPK